MSEKIEFEGEIDAMDRGSTRLKLIVLADKNTDAPRLHQRYHVMLTPAEPELKPCPFCGGKAIVHEPGDGWLGWSVRCTGCLGATLIFGNERSAIDGWNRRDE